MKLLDKSYSAEELADVERDVCEALEEIDAPIDEYGFFEGSVKVTIEYVKDEQSNS